MSLPTLLTWSPTRGWSVESPSPSSWPAPAPLWSSPPLSGEGCPAHAPPCDARHHGDRHWDSLQVGTPGISIAVTISTALIQDSAYSVWFVLFRLYFDLGFTSQSWFTGQEREPLIALPGDKYFPRNKQRNPPRDLNLKSNAKTAIISQFSSADPPSTPPGRQHLSQHQGPHHGGRPTSGGDRGLSYPLSFLCFEPVLNHEISDWHNFISPFLHFDILLFWIYPIPHTLTIFGGGQAKAPPSFSPSFWIFDGISAPQIWFCLEERHLEINKYILLASILSNTILIYLHNP